MIALIDYGMGNLRSVQNAFDALAINVSVVTEPSQLRDAAGIVLPGVGAFGAAMNNLASRGFDEALEREVKGKGKPFIGLCVGMQLLATRGLENGSHAGFGWIDGTARRLSVSPELRLPHIGWNDVRFLRSSNLNRGVEKPEAFYFVHSYVFEVEDRDAVAAVCEYGESFAACVEKGNIFGVQFHPEKSHLPGLNLLRNWADFATSC